MKQLSYIFSSKNVKIKNAIRFIIFIGLLCFILRKLTFFLSEKTSYYLKNPFYKSKEKYDVLILGTSHSYAGIFPMELYRYAGISSYCLAIPGERFAMTYYSLKDAFEYNKPKVVVLDTHGFDYGNQKNDPTVPERMHKSFDAMKLGHVRFEAIRDIVNEELKMSFWFPLSLYHSRWNSLGVDDFKDPNDYAATKGAMYLTAVANINAPILISQNDRADCDNYSTQYLQKIIELCDSEGVKLLLVTVPFGIPEVAQRNANQAFSFAEKNEKVEYVNLLYFTDEMGFNYATDNYDSSSYLNPLGARKVSKWLAEYIKNNYDVEDCRYGNDAKKWKESEIA